MSGLCLPLHATLKGHLRWRTLDERGVPEVARTPSGLAIAPPEGIKQHNLITDLGLDLLAGYTCLSHGGGWRHYLAVGTGSAEPSVADTTLDNEVQRSSSSGSFSQGSTTRSLDTGDNVWRAVVVVNRLVTMTADRNLTEFGFSPTAAGNIVVRELLRDSGGNPVTVSLLKDKSILVEHTLTIEIPAPEEGLATTINIDEYDAANNLLNSTPYSVRYGLGVDRDSDTPHFLLWDLWDPASGSSGSVGPLVGGYSRVYGTSQGLPAVGTHEKTTYVAGTYTRTQRATAQASSHNGTWAGFRLIRNSAAWSAGFLVEFVSPASFEKVNTNTVQVGVICSWGRAGGSGS